MRLLRLHIYNYLMFRDLDLLFDRPGRLETGSYALDFLVGVNGSGKSTVLRALAQIISDLRADRTTDFSYELEYDLQGRDGPYRVSVEQRDGIRRMAVQGPPDVPAPRIPEGAIDQSYLPNRLVIHSTGSDAEWDRILSRAAIDSQDESADQKTLDNPELRAVKEVPGHLPRAQRAAKQSEAEPPFLLVRASRLPLVTLCGLLANLASDAKPLEDVLNATGLSSPRAFSLRFRLHTALSDFRAFEYLLAHGPRHVRQGNDYLLVFDLSQHGEETARNLLYHEDVGGSLGLFRGLDRLLEPGETGEPTLQEVSIFFEREIETPEEGEEEETVEQEENKGEEEEHEEQEEEATDDVSRLLLLDWLSDGEQSFLGRMALLAMLDAEDSLILLDEPEVHFNDYWKRQIVALLDNVMRAHANHLLIATHSSIVLSDVTEGHITSLVRGDGGFAENIEFTSATFGADPSSIMVHIFDTGTAVGAFATQYLASALQRDDPAELTELLKQVGTGYWSFRIQDRLERHDAS